VIDASQLRYLPQEQVWLLASEEQEYEVIIAGRPEGPNQDRLSVVEAVLSQSEQVFQQARTHLGSFVSYERLDSQGNWHIEGIEFGRREDDPCEQCEILLTLDGDLYGLWYVTCSFPSQLNGRLYPVAFGRRQQ
jgi:hypothetical protein